MELVLTKKEVEDMLLEAIEKKWPSQFNRVAISASYTYGKDYCTFSKRKEGEEE